MADSTLAESKGENLKRSKLALASGDWQRAYEFAEWGVSGQPDPKDGAAGSEPVIGAAPARRRRTGRESLGRGTQKKRLRALCTGLGARQTRALPLGPRSTRRRTHQLRRSGRTVNRPSPTEGVPCESGRSSPRGPAQRQRADPRPKPRRHLGEW